MPSLMRLIMSCVCYVFSDIDAGFKGCLLVNTVQRSLLNLRLNYLLWQNLPKIQLYIGINARADNKGRFEIFRFI